MFNDSLSDRLEIEFGTAILSDLIGQRITQNKQPVRLFDRTRNSSEVYFRADTRGKPYIQDFQRSVRYYPLKAYCCKFNVDFKTALSDLSQEYLGVDLKKTQTPKSLSKTKETRLRYQPKSPPKVDYLPVDIYKRCQRLFEINGLYEYLRYTFDRLRADEVFLQYRLGTSNRWRHLGYLSTCLPQFDLAGNLRQVKIMPFDAINGRRIKKNEQAEIWDAYNRKYNSVESNSSKTYFAGKQIAKLAGMTDVNLQQCLFGEHLLAENPDQKVALVEGESTAIICSICWPQYIWLATSGSAGAGWTKPEAFGVLKGRDVTLWPDTGKFTEWSQKAEPLRSLVRSLYVSDYVQKNTPEGMTNVDLRDLLMRPRYYPADGSGPIYGEVLF